MSEVAIPQSVAVRLPMVHSVSSLVMLFENIETSRVPKKVDRVYLSRMGFIRTNDNDLCRLLRLLGLLKWGGTPTNTWRQYRDGSAEQRQTILAQAIRRAYSPLLQTFPDAERAVPEELDLAVRPHVKSRSSRERTIRTFIKLCEMAGLRDEPSQELMKANEPLVITPTYQVVIGLPANGSFDDYLRMFEAFRRVFYQ